MIITSKDNEKLKLVRKLAERKHREREGLFVSEGEDLLEAGLAAGFEPRFVLRREGTAIDKGEEVEGSLLDGVSQLASGTRVIAVWPLPGPDRARVTPMGANHARSPWIYLHGVGDPGNVGSIVRTAAALGASRVALGPDCADPYGHKALRASMGSIFAIDVARCAFEDTPAPRVALIAHGGDASPPAEAATLCFGSERDGLPAEIVEATDASWTIPMAEGAVESLGVAAAAAIALSRIGSSVREESA